MTQPSIALLGLGTMGSGMAENLLKAGFPLVVYNRTSTKAQPLAALGARIAATPAEAAAGASVILAMLSDDKASRAAWTGSEGALASAPDGATLIECSTLSPTWIRQLQELSAAAAPRTLTLLDAPVTGSRVQAHAGQLTFLVGGPAETLDRVRPVLEVMSKEIIHLGPLGSGQQLKLVNNFLCGVQVASLAEGLVWLERSGLDVEKALAVLKRGAPGSPLLANISTRMTTHDQTVNFLLSLMSKDLLYAHAEAAENGVDLTTAASARKLFESAAAQGFAERDMSAVVEPLRQRKS